MDDDECRFPYKLMTDYDHMGYMSIYDHNRVKNGQVVIYWDNYKSNDIKFIVNFKNNKVDGMISKYYRDGDIDMITFVNNGKIVHTEYYMNHIGYHVYTHEYDSSDHYVTELVREYNTISTKCNKNGLLYKWKFSSYTNDKYIYSNNSDCVKFVSRLPSERLVSETYRRRDDIIYDKYGFVTEI